MDKRKMKKLLILNLPYFLVGLFATNLGEAWRLAEGADSSAKILSFFHALPIALNNPFPSFHPLDLLIGILCGAGLRLAVYLKGKNAKKYRHNVEYGSARWGTAKDIEPFIAPKFEDNVILTKTERLMMSNRPKFSPTRMKPSSTKTHGILPERYARRKSPEWQTAPTPTVCLVWCTVRIVVLEWDISVPKQIIAKRTMIQIPLSNAAIIGAKAANVFPTM